MSLAVAALRHPAPMTPPRPPPTARHDARDLRAALGAFTTGVAIVTTRAADGLHGLTINSFASVSLDPPLALWSLDLRSHSLHAFESAPAFETDVETESFYMVMELIEGAPLLVDCVAAFECRRVAMHDGGDHAIFVGRIERYRADHRPVLVFSRGRFGGFSE